MSLAPLIGLDGGINTYVYVNGDPLRLSDPSGNCPWCVGAIIGGTLDVVLQITLERKSLDCIDWVSVGTSAALGAIGGGAVSVLAKLAKARNAAKTASKISNNTAREKELAQKANELPQELQRNLERQGYTRIDQVPGGAPYAEGPYPGWVKELGGANKIAPGGRLPRSPQ